MTADAVQAESPAVADDLIKRLHRLEGQVRGIERMIREGRECIEVITQISAVQAALDKVALGVITAHVRDVAAAEERGEASLEGAEAIIAAFARLRHRG